MSTIEQLLKDYGPCLSTELTQRLVDYDVTPEAARQRVSRAPAPVKRLAYLPFPRNARFMYLQEQYGSPQFWDALERALLKYSPAYGGAIAALRQRGDLMPKSHFDIACGSPLALTRHLSPAAVLGRLIQAKLFEEIDVPRYGPCIARVQSSEFYDEMVSAMQARLVVEDIMLKAVRGWARSLGMVSYDKTKIRGDDASNPQVGRFAWDFTAPSYLGALVDRTEQGKPNPGFLVCDILLNNEVTTEGLAPFIGKCRTVRSLKVGRCMQIFIADRYSNEAFKLAKAEGIVPATPDTLFGREVAASLHRLSEVLRQAADSVSPQVFDELFNGLSRIEGAATNLRGALFEFWAAEAIRQTYPAAQIRMNRIFTDETGRAEVDVQASVGFREVRFYECKGYQPGGLIPDEEVDRWLEKRIPLVYKQARDASEWRGMNFHFEFWTTGRLSDAAIAKITTAQNTIRSTRYTLAHRDAENLASFAAETKDRALIGTLRQHFLDHPMAKIQRAEERRQRKERGTTQEDADVSYESMIR
ncbi:hypothetical protein [Burkholderia stagnalis]|uniref:hypothetical protein n=1 Tax=Burkholderia stagnalis TaxID=1503054 RepID=UPI000F5AC7C9|nr:hypothetical protein [Burkholderia stagnalis]